ncbi:MAG: hypothetical protein V8Q09_11400 [Adlercreutzia sp.]
MTANHRKDALEVAHITGVQGIRAAMARLADEEADVPLPGATRPRRCRWGVAPVPCALPTTTVPEKPAGTAAPPCAVCANF